MILSSGVSRLQRKLLAGARVAPEVAQERRRAVSKVRVVIENITPQVDCGRFPAKRAIGESVAVEADVFTDGHDAVAALALLSARRRP